MALRKVTQTAAAAQAAPAAGVGGPNLMNPETFVSGVSVPAGDYCIFMEVKQHQPTDKATGNSRGDAKLGTMMTAYAISDINAEPKTQHYSYGKNAHKAYAPNADGSGIVAIPGAPPQNLYHDTAWDLFLREAINAGMSENLKSPKDLNGAWVRIVQVKEPDSWSSMAAQTGATAEVQGKPREPGKVSVIGAFLEGGKPWEGGGGLEKLKAGFKPTAAAGTTAAAAAPAGAAAAEAPAGDAEEMLTAAKEATEKVLETAGYESGCPRSILRNQSMEYLEKTYGKEDAEKIFAYVFESPERLGLILGDNGFKLDGLKVVLKGK